MATLRAVILVSLVLGAAISGAQTVTKVTAAAPQGWGFWNESFAGGASSGLTVVGAGFRSGTTAGSAARGALWILTGSQSPSLSDGGAYLKPAVARTLGDATNLGYSFYVSSGSAFPDAASRVLAPQMYLNLDTNGDGRTDDALIYRPADNGYNGAAADLNRFVEVNSLTGRWRLASEFNAGRGESKLLSVWRGTYGSARIVNVSVAFGGYGASNAHKIGGVDNVVIGYKGEAARKYDFE